MHDKSADIVSDQTHFREVERINELNDIFRIVADIWNGLGIFTFSEAAKIRRNDIESLREDRYVLPPRIPEFWSSM